MTHSVEKQVLNNEQAPDLGLLLRMLWRSRILIVSAALGCAIVAAAATYLLPNTYRAATLVAPAQSGGQSSLMNLAGQFEGIASLAGIDLGGEAGDMTAFGLEVLKSRQFIFEFIERHDVLPELMAAKSWDKVNDVVVFDEGEFEASTREWKNWGWRGDKSQPSLLEAHEKFLDILIVREFAETGFVSISIDHYSPSVARQWANWLVDDVNREVMRMDVQEAEQAIEYLSEQAQLTSVAELQSVFYRLIERKMEVVMLAQVTDEYLFRTIDPAVAPEKKHRPMRLLSGLLGGFVGGSIFCLFILCRPFLGNQKVIP